MLPADNNTPFPVPDPEVVKKRKRIETGNVNTSGPKEGDTASCMEVDESARPSSILPQVDFRLPEICKTPSAASKQQVSNIS